MMNECVQVVELTCGDTLYRVRSTPMLLSEVDAYIDSLDSFYQVSDVSCIFGCIGDHSWRNA